jgi:glucose/arabinose dehydrogenase
VNAQPVAEHLNFPTSIALDDQGNIYVAESGLPFGGAQPGGAVLRVGPGSARSCLLSGLRPPVNGIFHYQGSLIISEGGYPGRISRLSLANGEWTTLLDDLPGFGNYHTNMAVVGPDGKLYFSQGAMTNSGIIGLDSHDLGWLRRVLHNCDIPGYDIVLAGVNAETPDPLSGNGKRAVTGAFAPFGAATIPGQRMSGRVPCTSSVMRCNLDGSHLELVAWGLRNAYGLRFLPDGRLLATDQGADDRGSRPLANCPDVLFEVRPGAWYGWPDFVGGRPVTDDCFHPDNGPKPGFLLSNHQELPPPERPLVKFKINTAAVKFDVVPPSLQPWAGQLVVALFGDERSLTAPAGPRVGRTLVRVDPADWSVHPTRMPLLYRPIDVGFAPCGSAVYVLDFGDFEITPEKQVKAAAGSGRLWKLTPDFMEV